MGMHRLYFLVPALLVTFSSTFVGGVLVLVVVFGICFDPDTGWHWRLPKVFYMFTAASFSDLLGYVLFLNIPSELPGYGNVSEMLLVRLWLFFLIAGFVSVLITIFVLYIYSGLGKRVLLVGSIILLFINILGIVVFTIMKASS